MIVEQPHVQNAEFLPFSGLFYYVYSFGYVAFGCQRLKSGKKY